MHLFGLPALLHRLGTSFGKMFVSVILPHEVVLPPKLRAQQRGVAPLERSELIIDDYYLHVIVAPNTYELSVSEFSPLSRPQMSNHPFMSSLEGFLAKNPITENVHFLHIESLGLEPDRRENFHRVFLATDEARSVIRRLVEQNDLGGYFLLIKGTYSWREIALMREDKVYQKIASWCPESTLSSIDNKTPPP